MKMPIELVNGHTIAFPVHIIGYFLKADIRVRHFNGLVSYYRGEIWILFQ